MHFTTSSERNKTTTDVQQRIRPYIAPEKVPTFHPAAVVRFYLPPRRGREVLVPTFHPAAVVRFWEGQLAGTPPAAGG